MSEKEVSAMKRQGSQEGQQIPLQLRTYRMIRNLLVGFLVISISSALFSYIFYTPKAHRIHIANSELVTKYQLLQDRIATSESRLAEIANRDNYIYRSLFGVDTLPLSTKSEPYPKSHYSHLEDDPYSPILIENWERMDILAKDLYRQSRSLDELQILAKNKEQLSAAIPAVWPIDRTKLKYGIGAFGMRLHPIYKRYILHKGIDLPCDTGTPIYATADAIVQKSEQGYRRSGYGQMLLLKHDFGYQTRYAHLSKRLVNVGDTVRRGDLIGEVGSTGGSTGPHLHYEVILRGQELNPINFFNRNMSKEEYQLIMEQVQETKYETFDE